MKNIKNNPTNFFYERRLKIFHFALPLLIFSLVPFLIIDAAILVALQNGLALAQNFADTDQLYYGEDEGLLEASEAWKEFLSDVEANPAYDYLRKLWGQAEQSATNYGASLVAGHDTNLAQDVFLASGSLYRKAGDVSDALSGAPLFMPEAWGWFSDPREEFPALVSVILIYDFLGGLSD